MLYTMTLMKFFVIIIPWLNRFVKNIFYIKRLLFGQMISHECQMWCVTFFADETGFLKKFQKNTVPNRQAKL